MPTKKKVTNTSSTRQQLIKGGLIVGIFTVLASPLGYFIRVLFSRTLSVEMYGLLYAVLSFMGIFITYNDLGFGYALSYLLPKYSKKKDYNTSWHLYTYEKYIEVLTALGLSLLIAAGSSWLATNYFKTREAAIVVKIFCLYFIANSYLSGLQKFFVGLRQELFHVSIQPLTLILTLAGSCLFFFMGKGNIYTYALSWALSYLVVGVLFTIINHRINTPFVHQRVSWQPQLFRKMLRYALPTLLTSSIFTFIVFVDTFYLTLFHGVSQVGFYNIIIPIVTLPAILFTPLDNFLFPYISHFADEEKNKIVTLMASTQSLIILIAAYVGLFIALFPAPIIGILFGNQWLGSIELPLTLYASCFVIFALSSHFNTIISGIGRVHDRLRVSLVLAVSNVVLGGLLIARWGVLGAVVTNISINSLSLVLYSLIIKQEIPFTFPVLYTLKTTLLVLGITFIIKFLQLHPYSFGELIATGMAYTVIFFLGVLVLRLYNIDPLLVTQLKQKLPLSKELLKKLGA